MSRDLFLLLVCFFCASLSVLGQAKEISQEDYYKVYRESMKKYYDSPIRRETSNKESHKEGKSGESQILIDESIKPDKWRFVVIDKSDNKTEKSELVKI